MDRRYGSSNGATDVRRVSRRWCNLPNEDTGLPTEHLTGVHGNCEV